MKRCRFGALEDSLGVGATAVPLAGAVAVGLVLATVGRGVVDALEVPVVAVGVTVDADAGAEAVMVGTLLGTAVGSGIADGVTIGPE